LCHRLSLFEIAVIIHCYFSFKESPAGSLHLGLFHSNFIMLAFGFFEALEQHLSSLVAHTF